MELRFSIVAPCLNEENMLPVFLESLVHQSFKDFELILVDGGSTDNSRSIIHKYLDKMNIMVFTNETRNIGYIRNLGAYYARGELMFQTSADVYLPPDILHRLNNYFQKRALIALGGRTFPMGTSVISYLGYGFFDFIRFLMTCNFMPFKKIRPSGNFFVIKKKVFNQLGGYPEVPINEDGLFGFKLDDYIRNRDRKSVEFSLKFYVRHHVKRFEKLGGIRSLLFYLYVFTNIFPFLKMFLDPLERRSGELFQHRKDLQQESLWRRFMEWL